MPSVVNPLEQKIKVSSDIVDVSGDSTAPTIIYQCIPASQKFVLKKIIIYNKDTADHEVTLGEYNVSTASWVKDKFIFKVSAGQTLVLGSDDLPEDYVVTEDATNSLKAWAAYLDAAVTANPVKIKAEFELR